jgi:polyketide biosynthesis enoyl-CoA hydratase PksI
MGSTFILPQKLEISLAEEMMLTAATYRGEELQRRGVPFPVLPRDGVLAHALEIARNLAEKPRVSLATLKAHLVAPLREQLPRFIDQEIAMHELTFHRPEVRDRIDALFGM